jgi:hypothetical protein
MMGRICYRREGTAHEWNQTEISNHGYCMGINKLMIQVKIGESSIDISVSWNWWDNYNKNDCMSQMVFARHAICPEQHIKCLQ